MTFVAEIPLCPRIAVAERHFRKAAQSLQPFQKKVHRTECKCDHDAYPEPATGHAHRQAVFKKRCGLVPPAENWVCSDQSVASPKKACLRGNFSASAYTDGTQYSKECFEGLRDPRVIGRTEHNLTDILFLTLCAVLCGMDDWESAEAWGTERLAWLRQCVELENGGGVGDPFKSASDSFATTLDPFKPTSDLFASN